MSQGPGYSRLEVSHPNPQQSDSQTGYSTLQVEKPYPPLPTQQNGYSDLQVQQPNLRLFDSHKEPISGNSNDSEFVVSSQEKEVENNVDDTGASGAKRTILGLKRRTFWILIVVFSLLTIAAVIGGAVGGTRDNDSNSEGSNINRSDPNNPSSATSSTQNASTVPSASRVFNGTDLASVAWNDSQQIQQQRLYLQVEDHMIWELSWNSSAKQWFTSNEAVAQANPASPLAAAMLGSGDGTQMVLYYVNEAGVLTQTYTTNFRDWYSSAIVSSDGTSVYPANDSSLSAVWYKDSSCGDCSYNSLAVYQDRDALGFQLINSTKGGDTSHTSIDGNPTDGSGSVFDLQWRSPTLARLRLTYQLRSGQLATATYNGTTDEWQAYETPDDTGAYVKTSQKAPLASFAVSPNPTTIVPSYLFVFSCGTNGVSIDWWDNADPNNAHWGTHQSPPTMQNVDELSPLAANDAERLFVMQEGVVKEFQVAADGTTWSLVANVTGE